MFSCVNTIALNGINGYLVKVEASITPSLPSFEIVGLPEVPVAGEVFYSIKDEGSIKKGTVISTAFAIIVAGGCYFLGGCSELRGV